MIAKVYDVEKVGLGFTAASIDGIAYLVISAEGRVNSSGWFNPELAPWVYIIEPADGILDLDFLATPPAPGTIVTYGFTRVQTHLVLDIPSWVKGVRVHASSNRLEAMLPANAPKRAAVPLEGLPLPWPFPWFNPRVKG